MAPLQARVEEPQGHISRLPLVGLGAICCIPMLVIAVVLLTAGGTKAGLLIPAIVAGAGVGMLMFTALTERPLR